MPSVVEGKAFERALAAVRAGKLNDAVHLFKSVLRKEPRHVAALNLLGVTLSQLGKFDEAETYLHKALQVNARSDATFYNYGVVLKELKRPAEAFDRFSQALAINSAVPETWNNRGTVLNDLNRHGEAIEDFDHAIKINPRYAEAFCNKGKSLAVLGRFAEATSAFDSALALRPMLTEAWLGRGHLLAKYKQYQHALQAYQNALALQPTLVEAWLVSGNINMELQRNDLALAAYDKALALKPDCVDAWWGRGNVFYSYKQYKDAEAAYDRALALNPDLAEAWLGHGNALHQLGRLEDALAAYDKALTLKPDLAEARLGRGNVLYGLKDYAAALTEYDSALTLKPSLAEAWLGRGSICSEFRYYANAAKAYDRALAAKPDLNYAAGSRLMAKLMMSDWTNLEAEVEQFLLGIGTRSLLSDPFAVLAISSSAPDQLTCTRGYVKSKPAVPKLSSVKAYSHDRIRVAYLSADFHEHATTYLLAGLFEHHDKSRFDITGISFRPNDTSALRKRVKGALERFIDVGDETDQKIAELLRDLEIDIAVDLMGFTHHARLGIFARRPAPIQVSYLGYLGTTGVEFIDYVIADKIALPSDQQQYYTEKIVHLPDCFLVNDNTLEIAPTIPSREEAGLPAEGFVFCSFNNSYKLNPPVFESWMRLLRAVEGSVLWLVESNADMVGNLRREAQRCGIDEGRIIFAPRVPLPEHLARQRLAGLFLDTIPYNAGATGAAALWAGLPTLTMIGETFVGRMAASMLHAVGLPELVAHSLAEYEALALKIATEPAFCAALKDKLARNRNTYPLFDTKRFTRNLEAAYDAMRTAHQHGRPPAPFAVNATENS